MIDLLSQTTDSIPFILKKDVAASIDTIPANDFLSYEYLPLDSSKLYYNTEAICHKTLFSGMEGLVRPFIHQFGDVLFLVFTLLFVLGAILFSNNGWSHFANIKSVFSLDSNNTKTNNVQTTAIDAWSKIFYGFQTYVVYSILFFAIAVTYSNQYYSANDYLLLYAQLLVGLFIFTFVKILFYRLMEGVFAKPKMNILSGAYTNIFYLSGAIGFLPVIVYLYIPEVKIYALFFLLALFIIGRVAVIVQSYVFFIKYHIGSSYFFVYLCGVEILPYFLLYKAAISMN